MFEHVLREAKPNRVVLDPLRFYSDRSRPFQDHVERRVVFDAPELMFDWPLIAAALHPAASIGDPYAQVLGPDERTRSLDALLSAL